MKHVSEGGVLVGICTGATAIAIAWATLSAGAGAADAVGGGRSSTPLTAPVATAPAAGVPAASVAAPLSGSGVASQTPDPQRTPIVPSLGNAGLAVTVAPGETVHVLSVDEWRAISAAYPENPPLLAKIGTCESNLNPAQVVMDVDGTPSIGAFGVKPQFHGAVPKDLASQAVQAARILRRYGTAPFPSAKGCAAWSR